MSLELRLYGVLAMGAIGCAQGCTDPDDATMTQRSRARSPVESTSVGDAGHSPSLEDASNDLDQGHPPGFHQAGAVAADANDSDGGAAADAAPVADGAALGGAAEACRPGAQRCSVLTSSPEQCDATGTWTQSATCRRPEQSCSVSSGAAVCSDNATFTLGNVDEEDGWTPWTVPNGQAYFIPVELPAKSVLSLFVLRAAGGSGSCTMAIYQDAGGKPGKLLAETFARVVLQLGRQSAAPNGEISLKEGRYWMGGDCFLWPTGAQLYSRPSDGATYFRFAHAEATYANDPAGELLTGETFSFGITVGRLP